MGDGNPTFTSVSLPLGHASCLAEGVQIKSRPVVESNFCLPGLGRFVCFCSGPNLERLLKVVDDKKETSMPRLIKHSSVHMRYMCCSPTSCRGPGERLHHPAWVSRTRLYLSEGRRKLPAAPLLCCYRENLGSACEAFTCAPADNPRGE